jgi:hypothetical protein
MECFFLLAGAITSQWKNPPECCGGCNLYKDKFLTDNYREKSKRKEGSYNRRRIWKEAVPNDDIYLMIIYYCKNFVMVQICCSDDKDEVSVWPSFAGMAVLAAVSRTDHTRHKCRQEFTGIKIVFLHPATIS